MATNYIIDFSDPTKPRFAVGPGSTNSSRTSLKIFGQGAITFGEGMNENVLHLLENFASPTAPLNPIEGQLWYDNANGNLLVFNGTIWIRPENLAVQSTAILNPNEGDMWWDSTATISTSAEDGRNLKVYIGGMWVRVVDDYLPRDGRKPMTGNLNLDNHKIENVTNPSVSGDAMNLGYADGKYALIISPALTGAPTAPTATPGTNTTQLATTAFVTTADNLKAPLVSPALTGVPTAPTATPGTNTTQLATTAFVLANPGSHVHNDATTLLSGFLSAADKVKLNSVESGATADLTANEILTLIKTVDGSGSGLDADLLDGQTSSYFYSPANPQSVVQFLAQSLSGNGYVKFSNGLIIQWMSKITTANTNTWTFPIAFPNAIFHVGISQGVLPGQSVATGQSQQVEYVYSITGSGCNSYQYNAVGTDPRPLLIAIGM